MNAFFSYLIQVSILTALFITLYHFVFRRLKHYKTNRIYLLSSLALAFLLPLLNIPLSLNTPIPITEISDFVSIIPVKQVPQTAEINPLIQNTPVPEYQQLQQSFQFPWMILYLLGASILLIRSLWMIFKITRLRYQYPSRKISSIRLISGEGIPPFSFFKWVFLNSDKQDSEHDKLILTHELAHSKQLHSIDLLFVQLLQAILWFNPLIILFKKALKENHEFLADEAVLKTGVSLSTYADSLKAQLFTGSYQRIASYFRGSTLRKRMTMATKTSTNSKWRYLFIIPIFALAFALFSFGSDPINEPVFGFLPKKFTVVIDPGHGGEDPGVVAENGLKESDIVLDIAKQVKRHTDRSINVILLREKDDFLSLYERMKMTMDLEPDLFISLHLDSSTGGYSDGWSIYYSPFYDWAYQSAQVGEWFKELFTIRGNGPRFGPDQAPNKILQETYCPAVMLTLGYLDNQIDQKTFNNEDSIKEVAENLAASINEIRSRIEITLPKGDIEELKNQTRRIIHFTLPIRQEYITEVRSRFSTKRFHPILKINRPHTGIDIIANKSIPVLATSNGIVSQVIENRSRSGYGTNILIDHQNGYSSFYAHLDKVLIKEGQKVTSKQIIGLVGQTGLAMESHLHFEIRKGDRPNEIVNMVANLIDHNFADTTRVPVQTVGISQK